MDKNYFSLSLKKGLKIIVVDAVVVLLKSTAKPRLQFLLKLAEEYLNCKDIYVKFAVIFGRRNGFLVCIL